MDLLPLLLLVVFVLGYSGVNSRLLRYGEQVSNHNETAFLEQICPKPNSRDRKYVRIKTFNDKYVWAYPTHKGDTSYLRTRCCGVKDAVGRKDITLPGTKTIFIVHCLRANNENVFRTEILSSSKNPSCYYFDADPVYSQYGVYANKLRESVPKTGTDSILSYLARGALRLASELKEKQVKGMKV